MSDDAKKLVEKGIELYKNNDKDKAFTCFTKAAELDPTNARALGNRGRIFFEQAKLKRALIDLDKAIELDATNYLFFHNRGNIYFSLKEFDKSLEDYDQVIKLKPDYAWAHENIGVINYQRLEMDEALKYFDNALKYDQSEAQFFHNRGSVYLHQKKYDEAFSDYENAIELDPQSSWAHANLGIIYSEKEEHQEALNCLDKAITLDPTNHVFYKTRSETYVKMGEFEFAQTDYEQAIKLGFDPPKRGFWQKKVVPSIKKTFKHYWLTLTFIGAYIVAFIVMQAVFGGYDGLSAQTNGDAVTGNIWQIFSSVFYAYGSSFLDDISFLSSISNLQLYSGIVVLLTFIWCLFVYGRRMERTFPKWVFPTLYLGFGFLGNAMFYLLSPNQTFCISNLSAIWGLAGLIIVDTIVRLVGKGEGFESIGTFLEFLDGNVDFFVGIVMVIISSALSQNGWHFFIGTGMTFGIGMIIGLITGLKSVKKTKKS
ncbi:MAG: tetratricopeptide repeat protein [Candidatus Heimdallarchaeota archaeon]|nr:tetratricopeptide repeat protein [Candidatus Heimdallarchaeota archaeon]